ncbi:MAG: hypothetical protein ABIN01_23890 [Ferruginibacter sp.]
MELRKEDLPATIQAFELQNDQEVFIAEQVVNSQSEVETFTARYTGKLIKVKKFSGNETGNGNYTARPAYATHNKKSSSTGLVMIIIILIIVALVIYGFSTGWIQEKFNLKV